MDSNEQQAELAKGEEVIDIEAVQYAFERWARHIPGVRLRRDPLFMGYSYKDNGTEKMWQAWVGAKKDSEPPYNEEDE